MKAHDPPVELLVVDDDVSFGASVKEYFQSSGVRTIFAPSIQEGLEQFRKTVPKVVLLDQRLPDGNGIDLCKKLAELDESAKIVFATAFPAFEDVVEALRAGAYDYLTKPIELQELEIILKRCWRALELERIEQLQQLQNDRDRRESVLVGMDGGLRELKQLLAAAIEGSANVLITGETGTGKSVLARHIHHSGPRGTHSLVSLNCAGLPRHLVESELFGHQRGAFTGAHSSRKGVFELAHNGTLFLDEIGALDPDIQSKLLSAIEEKRIRPVGAETARPVDVRIVSATNSDLEVELQRGRFREDLFFRLNVIRIHLPPLRDRLEDLEPLCELLVQKLAPNRSVELAPEELDRLRSHRWPGNLRELRNTLERALALQQGPVITPSSFLSPAQTSHRSWVVDADDVSQPIGRALTLAEVEREHIERTLALLGGNRARTAISLGISESTLRRKLARYRQNPGGSQKRRSK